MSKLYKIALVIAGLCLAAAIWAMVSGCSRLDGAGRQSRLSPVRDDSGDTALTGEVEEPQEYTAENESSSSVPPETSSHSSDGLISAETGNNDGGKAQTQSPADSLSTDAPGAAEEPAATYAGTDSGSAGETAGGPADGSEGGAPKPVAPASEDDAGTAAVEQPAHVHDWQPVCAVVHHQETGHYETQTVTEAWDEPVYEGRCVCSACGGDFGSPTEVSIHILEAHGGLASYSAQKVQVDTIHHEAVTQEIWVVDQAAWDEQVVTGYRCSCGAER